MISTHTEGQLTILSLGLKIFQDSVSKESEKPEGKKELPVDKKRPKFKEMTGQQYLQYLAGHNM